MPLLFRSEQRSDVCVRHENRSEDEACNFVSNLCNLDSGNASPLGFVMVKWAGIVLAPGGIELARGRIEVLLGKNRSLLWFYPEFTTLYHKILKNDPLFETNQISRVFLLWLPFSDVSSLSKNSVKKWGIGNSFFKALFFDWKRPLFNDKENEAFSDMTRGKSPLLSKWGSRLVITKRKSCRREPDFRRESPRHIETRGGNHIERNAINPIQIQNKSNLLLKWRPSILIPKWQRFPPHIETRATADKSAINP